MVYNTFKAELKLKDFILAFQYCVVWFMSTRWNYCVAVKMSLQDIFHLCLFSEQV